MLTKNVNRATLLFVNEVGKRLRNARKVKGLSLRKFAERFGEDFSLLARIEQGGRYPPKPRLKKFAEVLSLTTEQLEALIAVERRGLDPCQMLPEIAPAPVEHSSIEAEAEKTLSEFCQEKNIGDGPIPIEDVIKTAYGLSTEEANFSKEKTGTTEAWTLLRFNAATVWHLNRCNRVSATTIQLCCGFGFKNFNHISLSFYNLFLCSFKKLSSVFHCFFATFPPAKSVC